MSRRIPGRERTAGRDRAARSGGWSPARALAAVAGGLVIVSLIAPALAGTEDRGEPAAGSTSPTSPIGEGGATTTSASPRAAATTGATSSPASGPPAPVPSRGKGTTKVLAVPGDNSSAPGREVRYTVEVEDGAGVDEGEFARMVREVLTDARGWETQDKVHFVNVSPEQAASGTKPDVHITLATPLTVDDMCAPLLTEGQVSCRNGDRVALNAVRWTQGVDSYPADLLHYRIYLINHEVGHAIGHGHEPCPAPGKPAPVMLQQTLGLQGCTRYPWPVPGKAL